MFDFIDLLRKKPEHVKTQFAFVTALIVTSIIFVIWLITFTYSGDKEISNKNTSDNGPIKDLRTTFSHFLDQVSGTKATTSSELE